MRRQPKIAMRHDSLLARYAETLGEMMMRRNTELATKAARAESELANRSKTAFLATMTHELRTPLNSIIGFSDVIAATKSDPKNAEYATHISKAGRRLLDVVSDVMDIAKIEAGTFALNRQPCDLFDIVEAAVDNVREAIEARNQTIEVQLPRDLPTLSVDYKRMRQLLVNLLSNANKFTDERGKILVGAERSADGGATISVTDTGVGMSPDQIAVALRPFGQVQGHLSRTQEGAGLGLPIARGLALQHGGELHIASQPGEGTTVTVFLPPDERQQRAAPARAAEVLA